MNSRDAQQPWFRLRDKLVGFFLCAVMSPLLAAVVSSEDASILSVKASHWAADWDAANWAMCWNEFSSEVQGETSLEQWSKQAAGGQSKLGKLTERNLLAVVSTAEASEIVTVQFTASFQNRVGCKETVTFRKQAVGKWAIVGHLITAGRWIVPEGTASQSDASVSSTAYQYSPPISATITDLSYGDKSPLQRLDLYLPPQQTELAPLVIWIHGGGFMVGDKRSMPRRNFGPAPKPTGQMGPYQIQVPDVAALVAKGYAVVSLNYRLGASMFAAAVPAVQDGKAAVRFLRANAAKYRLDPNRFAVWGNSAGGYMAAMLGVTGDQPSVFDDPTLGNATESSAVQLVVVWYGAEDRLPDPNLRIARYLPSAKVLPPFRIANGDADLTISAAQAQRLQDALVKAGAKSTLTILPGAGHEDPVYMTTQMIPTFAFLDQVFRR